MWSLAICSIGERLAVRSRHPTALLILEERLKEHQREWLLPPDVNVTALALRILAITATRSGLSLSTNRERGVGSGEALHIP
jgi:hypothetical protein